MSEWSKKRHEAARAWAQNPHSDEEDACEFLRQALDRIEDIEALYQRLLDDAGAEVSRIRLERYNNGELTFTADPELLKVMGHYLLSILEACGAPNYVAMTIGRVEGEDSGVELVAQRTSGKRPSEVAVERKARIETLEKRIGVIMDQSDQEAWENADCPEGMERRCLGTSCADCWREWGLE